MKMNTRLIKITVKKIRKFLSYILFGKGNFLAELSDETRIFTQAARHTNELEGDYLEFGTYVGSSFISAYYAIFNAYIWGSERWNIRKTEVGYYAFDSFEGLPVITGVDKNGPFNKGDYTCSQEQFLRNLRAANVDLEKVTSIKGWYENTLTNELKSRLNIKKARIVHIDCDLYGSTKLALDFVTSLIQEGTIIVFDDWFQFRGNPQRGEQKAFYEWLENNPQLQAIEYMKEFPFRNSFIITFKIGEIP